MRLGVGAAGREARLERVTKGAIARARRGAAAVEARVWPETQPRALALLLSEGFVTVADWAIY
jgi:hypothetical protein